MERLNTGVLKLLQENKEEYGNFIPDPDYKRVIDGKCGEHEAIITNLELMHKGIEVIQPKDIKVKFGLIVGEQLYYCPYNRSHQVLQSKWTQHLRKCRHNYRNDVKKGKPVIKMDECPYAPNLHHLSEFYMLRHVFVCPSRKDYDEKMNAFKKINSKRKESEPGIGNQDSVDPIQNLEDNLQGLYANGANQCSESANSELEDENKSKVKFEDWEEDNTAGGYNPQDKLARGFYYLIPRGLTKSERKEFDRKNAEKVEALGGWKKVTARQELEAIEEMEKLEKISTVASKEGKMECNIESRNNDPSHREKCVIGDGDLYCGASNVAVKLQNQFYDDDNSHGSYDRDDSDDSDSTLKAECDSDEPDCISTCPLKRGNDDSLTSYSDELETCF